MKITTVLFDLDGTLLPMDQDLFIKTYFGLLAKFLAPHGYDPEKLIASVWAGTKAMMKNTGDMTNEEAFWRTFEGLHGPQARQDMPLFDEFYRTRFEDARRVCGFDPLAAKCVKTCREMGLAPVLATSPLFPLVAVEKRLAWAGLDSRDFRLITTYDNCHYTKPNLGYYREILSRLEVKAENCLMVGNDVTEDMAARELGMEVFLLTDHMLNRENRPIDTYPQGGFEQLLDFLPTLA